MAKQSDQIKQILTELEELGDEKVFARNKKSGAGDKQFGVPMGDIRKVAKKLKSNHELSLALWETGNLDARHVAILIMVPKKLTAAELDRLVRSATFGWLADWLNSYIVKNHPDKETLREKWMKDKDPWAARAGWSLTAGRISKSPEGLDLSALLDRIESEMGKAPEPTQWTMNTALYTIGIHHAKLRKRAIDIGEKLGVYRDYPCSKGCVSPFAPIAIEEMVRRAKG